ncbi:MAG: aldehyde dehydrogenase family protein [Thermoanaerobaculia bacterium]
MDCGARVQSRSRAGGDLVLNEASSELVVRSPFDGSEVGRLQRPSLHTVEQAIAGAAAVFPKTRRIPTFERAAILRKIADTLRVRNESLARTLAREAGKPIKAARTEAERAVATFLSAASEVERRAGDVLPLDVNEASLGRWGVLRRVPVGPVCAITPFNFPLNLCAHKVAPAIAVGAPIVHKPASQTPLSALALAEIVHEAGWPAEAYVVLPVTGEAGEKIALDPRLPIVSFTGSAEVGWRLKGLAPKKRVWLELGGNAAAIVHSDADVASAAARCAAGGFGYAGQSCIALQRTLVHRPVFAAFRDAFVAATRKLTSGDPLDDSTDVGPMISTADADRIESWLEEAVAQGAELLCGGKRTGNVIEPMVLVNTKREMRVECEEVFGPIVTLSPYDTFAEALQRANDSRFGLQAGLFTQDIDRIQQAFDTLEVGGLIVNDVPTWRADRMPYGGVKDSGVGREGPAYAMDEYTEPRLLVFKS